MRASLLPFHSLLDIGAVIEKALIKHGIKLHSGRKMQKYLDAGYNETK